MKTTVYYYISPTGDNPFARFLDSLQKRQQTKILRIIFQISQYGLLSIIPHLKKITGTPLWEIRILGSDNIRVLYVARTQDSIFVLHSFVKKTQKTQKKEIVVALKRCEETKT